MSGKHDPPSSKKFVTAIKVILGRVVEGIVFPIVVAFLILDARFDPQRNQNPTTSATSSTQASKSPTTGEAIQTPSATPTSKPELTIIGIWEGTYTCSLGITGVTIDIDQTGNTVIADFYPVPDNPNILRGRARYKGDFNSPSRWMSFSEGKWINRPADWTAYPFDGQFDKNLKTFSGKMDGYRCTTINLKKRDS